MKYSLSIHEAHSEIPDLTTTDLESTFLEPRIGCLRQNHFN